MNEWWSIWLASYVFMGVFTCNIICIIHRATTGQLWPKQKTLIIVMFIWPLSLLMLILNHWIGNAAIGVRKK